MVTWASVSKAQARKRDARPLTAVGRGTWRNTMSSTSSLHAVGMSDG